MDFDKEHIKKLTVLKFVLVREISCKGTMPICTASESSFLTEQQMSPKLDMRKAKPANTQNGFITS